MSRKKPEELRSWRWFGAEDLRAFGHRSRAKQAGFDEVDFRGKPVIGVINTWSELNPCHVHLRERAEKVKRGVLQAGGFPVELPAHSVSETYLKPTSMLYRNFLAMETEELIRAHPLDGAVLLGGCDKTTPALLMGAASAGLPAIYVPAGPMLRGNWRGTTLGSGSDVWKYWAEKRAGNLSEAAWSEIEDGIARSPGHCMTMGTASTMTALAETLDMTLPGASSIPAVDSAHPRMAEQSGRLAVEMVWEDRRPEAIMTAAAFRNAVIVDMALGGSTNAIIHLIALAGRLGVKLALADFDEASRRVPVLADLRPSGRFLMEDFYYAGGLRGLFTRLAPLLDVDSVGVTGKPFGETLAEAGVFNDEVIRPMARPVYAEGATAVLHGNLAPDGCVIKPAAAEAHLLRHEGPAVVLDGYDEMARRIDDPELKVTADSVLVLRNAGPVGGPGMPEWGQLPIPKKLLAQGVRDMVRISDARMSGTSYGACVLHVAPEAAVGGPLALVREGDVIALDVPDRRIELKVSDAELTRRRAEWRAPPKRYERGFGAIYMAHIQQANLGCDFDVLTGAQPTPEPEIH